jgi:2-polyprenyl-3-methyl-5-hydroxy-6-metoxy-1,4-benzoquinol methylase
MTLETVRCKGARAYQAFMPAAVPRRATAPPAGCRVVCRTAAVPFPPSEPMARVGPGEGDDACEAFDHEGPRLRKLIESSLPESWSFDGKRVLDFGCGSGRVLRQFLE